MRSKMYNWTWIIGRGQNVKEDQMGQKGPRPISLAYSKPSHAPISLA